MNPAERTQSLGGLRPAVFLLAGLAAVVLFAGRPVRAADDGKKYDIKLNLKVGDRWTFDVSQKRDVKTDVTAGGQQQTIQQGANSRRKGTLEVLAVKDGLPTTVKVTFDKESTTSTSNGGQQNDEPFPLAGKTVTVRRDEAGKINIDAEGLDAATTAEVGKVVEPDVSIFPKHEVSVGEEWQGDATVLAQQLQLGQGDQISLKCKLLSISKVAGRPTADIFTAGKVSKNEQGIVTSIDLGGVSQVDLASGQPLQSDLIGKIAVKGNREVQGPNGQPVTVQANGDGTLEVHETIRPGEAMAGGDFPAPAPVPGPGPNLGPGPHPNPGPAGGGDAGAFVGTFKGDTLSAEFHQADAGLAGTLTLGAKKLPATAHVDGGKLVGSFEAGGSKFDFTASLEGNVMTLKSGSKSYTLTRPSDNPLDPGGGEAPKPKNPLDLQ